jgi:hypothetical protein
MLLMICPSGSYEGTTILEKRITPAEARINAGGKIAYQGHGRGAKHRRLAGVREGVSPDHIILLDALR